MAQRDVSARMMVVQTLPSREGFAGGTKVKRYSHEGCYNQSSGEWGSLFETGANKARMSTNL